MIRKKFNNHNNDFNIDFYCYILILDKFVLKVFN